MLVVTRRENETTVLYDEQGREIGRVTVLKTRSGSARLGFEAPRSVRIVRAEIDRTQEEKALT